MTLHDQLLRDEGLRLFPYIDMRGKLTIGVGRNLSDDGISQDEAMALLTNDIAAATKSLETTLPWAMALDPVRLDALINMTFNIGIGGLCEFRHMLAAVQAGDWVEARNQMLDSAWANQVGSRAQRLAIQMETGVAQ
jgi:lysozyme